MSRLLLSLSWSEVPHLAHACRSSFRPRSLAKLRTTPLSLLDLYRFGKTPTPAQVDIGAHALKTDSTFNDALDRHVHVGLYLRQRLRNAQFLHMELPRRIAQRIVELQRLPAGLTDMAGIRNVIGW